MINWIKNNRDSIIRNSFLIPILLVVIMSISHVVSWYDIGNPISWAIYLSIAIEIFALASVSASSIKMNRTSIWFLFGLVTIIQIIGNIFYGFKDIDPLGADFTMWMQLIEPVFIDWDALDHRRFLAAIQGGTLPMMSLTALHFYIKFGDLKTNNESNIDVIEDEHDIQLSEDSNISVNNDAFSNEIDDSIIANEINSKAEQELDKINIETDDNIDSNIDVNIDERIETINDVQPSFHFKESVNIKPEQTVDNQSKTLDKQINPNTGKFKLS